LLFNRLWGFAKAKLSKTVGVTAQFGLARLISYADGEAQFSVMLDFNHRIARAWRESVMLNRGREIDHIKEFS